MKIVKTENEWQLIGKHGTSLSAETAEDLASSVLEAVRYEFDDDPILAAEIDPLNGSEAPGYAGYNTAASLDGQQIAETKCWIIAGWVPPGASQDIDGNGLSNWGDSQDGFWSVRQGDGDQDGRDPIVDAVREWMDNIGNDLDDTVSVEWSDAVDALQWGDERQNIDHPPASSPTDEQIAEEMDHLVVEVDGVGSVQTGTWLGGNHAALFNGRGEIVEVERLASRSDVAEMIRTLSRQLAQDADELASDCWVE